MIPSDLMTYIADNHRADRHRQAGQARLAKQLRRTGPAHRPWWWQLVGPVRVRLAATTPGVPSTVRLRGRTT
jgi:hypothetical protein